MAHRRDQNKTVHHAGLIETSAILNEEAKLVLPAALLLFVFQVGTIVNPVFAERMSGADHVVAVVSLFALAVGAAGVLTPSAYGRSEPRRVSGRTLAASRLGGRAPLIALSIKFASDVYLEGRVVTRSVAASAALGALVLGVFATLWLVLPAVSRLQDATIGGADRSPSPA